jgi:hypothetical protein
VLTGSFPLGNGAINASLEGFWEGERGGGWGAFPETVIDSNLIASFRLDYVSDGNWSAGVYVENLTDEFTYDGQNNNGGPLRLGIGAVSCRSGSRTAIGSRAQARSYRYIPEERRLQERFSNRDWFAGPGPLLQIHPGGAPAVGAVLEPRPSSAGRRNACQQAAAQPR